MNGKIIIQLIPIIFLVSLGLTQLDKTINTYKKEPHVQNKTEQTPIKTEPKNKQSYTQQVIPTIKALQIELNLFIEEYERLEHDPTLISDTTYQKDVNKHIRQIEKSLIVLDDTSPTQKYVFVDKQIKKAVEQYWSVPNDYPEALSKLDVDTIKQIIKIVQEANIEMSEAQKLIDDVGSP